jgi:hypothetical protein
VKNEEDALEIFQETVTKVLEKKSGILMSMKVQKKY